MERLNWKRAVRRSQNTRIINEATAILETADSATLTSLLERLTTSNSELRQINSEMEDCITDGDLVAEYTTVVDVIPPAKRSPTAATTGVVAVNNIEPRKIPK
ncbi:hypothetical protein HPB47_008765 [Ixodes persulcatus]|uniref:Uncharacterized protein n=1 Tax=Ixodes persulcatus TaxID=34615 RepID=A0AC60P424_IXOPE|nr:hypothetical protein HPB47_008765 [Ixodes persulcatus]